MSNDARGDEMVRDLTTVGPADAAGEGARPVVTLETFNKAKEQESIRGKIAKWLVGSFVGFIALVLFAALATQAWCAYRDHCDAEAAELKSLKAVVELLLTPLVGLVGAVSGFYFGEKSGSADGKD